MANGTGYSAGNLEFALQTISNNTLSSLDAVIAKLKTITTLIGSTSSISKTLSTTTGRTTRGGASFNTKEQNKQLKISSLRLSNILNKVYFIRNYTKQMFRSVVDIVKNAVDYTETLNLWQVAMRGNTQEAEEFIKTMNKGYGIATQTLMQYQAIFRNMLSSLGGLTSDASYQLSEYLTQMALDYASLYNVSIQKAMTTFQSVLSGQVRPIRSIAGYDITETTIYQLYQQLGGTKTMRQLSQTEKRLLRIYAVFQQMQSSGAVGDLSKTMESTANQMRVFSEASKELGTWLGIILEHYLKPILPVLNAVTITLTNIVKAIAQMRGIKPQEFGVVESVAELNEELDETQGKLLSFDRFEALNSGAGEDNALGIDEKLLAGLSKYESIMGGLEEQTQNLINSWNEFLFVEGDPTKGLTDGGKALVNVMKSLGIVLASLVAFNLTKRIGTLISKVSGLTTKTRILNTALVSGLVFSILQAVEAFKEGNYWAGILYTALGVTLLGGIVALNKTLLVTIFQSLGKAFITLLMNATLATGSFGLGLTTLIGSFASLGIAIAGAFLLIKNWGDMSTWQKIIGVMGVATTAILGLAMALGAFHSAWSIGLAVTGIVAGIAMMVASIASVKKEVATPVAYKTGGQVEDGIFTMNKGEVMGTFDDGTSIVANNQQIISGIQQGVYSAVVSAMRQSGGNGGVGDVYLDGRKVGQTTSKYSHQENVRIGLVKATR